MPSRCWRDDRGYEYHGGYSHGVYVIAPNGRRYFITADRSHKNGDKGGLLIMTVQTNDVSFDEINGAYRTLDLEARGEKAGT